jgi:hypothetical protein
LKDLVVEANYVGNRGVWFESSSLIDLNAISIERLKSFGLDINNAADRTLLTSRLNSSTAASRGFNKAPYAGFPMTSTVAQSLRPYPQFSGIPVRWAPLGNTWYDSLQAKATKRFSRGLEFSTAFTWQKELTTMGPINDVFNRPAQKGLDGGSQPFVFVMNFNYTVPKPAGSRLLGKLGSNRWVNEILAGWTISGILRYSSGSLIGVPGSQNALGSLLFRGTRMSRVPGEPLYTVDLNCATCYDPNKDFVHNPKAWVDVPAGKFGDAPAYYDDYRSQRRPDEQLSFGRNFRVKESVTVSVRMEFFNVFNRLVLPSNPSSGNPLSTQTRNANGVPISGFGYISTATVLSSATSGMFSQRYGQLNMRVTF